MSLVTDLLQGILPQPEPNESPSSFRWRQTVSAYIAITGVALMGQFALIWGFVPFLFTGFASADQFHDLKQQSIDIRTSQIERSITEAKRSQCEAQASGNMDALTWATNALSKYQDDYYKVNKRYFPEPPCSALIVSK